MKKIIITTLFITLFYTIHTSFYKIYTRECQVVNINNNNNIVTTKDKNGNLWDFIGTGYYIGENIILIMHDNGTKNIKDDCIIKIK